MVLLGKGGALRIGIRSYLSKLKSAKIIADYIAGEDWSVFNETTRKVLDLDKSYSRDSDLGKSNAGVSIIVINWNKTSTLESTEYRPTRN